MADENEIDWARLDRLLAGECTAEEALETRRWLETHPIPEEFVAALRRAASDGGKIPTEWRTDETWLRLQKAATQAPGSRPRPMLHVHGRGSAATGMGTRATVLRIAAGLLLVVGASLTWYIGNIRRPSSNVSVATREFTTARGQRAEMTLSDGTRVMLGVESRLRIPLNYEHGGRDVYLDGEAYFEVVHDTQRPFAVHTAQAIVRDVGTKFAVRAYRGEARNQVIVSEGEVALHGTTRGSAPVNLHAGDLARVDTTGAASVVRNASIDRYLAWTQGRLILDEVSLHDALPQLARWYDLDPSLADSTLGSRRLAVSFRNESVREVLDAIAFLTNTTYELNGRTVRFSAKRVGQQHHLDHAP